MPSPLPRIHLGVDNLILARIALWSIKELEDLYQL